MGLKISSRRTDDVKRHGLGANVRVVAILAMEAPRLFLTCGEPCVVDIIKRASDGFLGLHLSLKHACKRQARSEQRHSCILT